LRLYRLIRATKFGIVCSGLYRTPTQGAGTRERSFRLTWNCQIWHDAKFSMAIDRPPHAPWIALLGCFVNVKYAL